jgi:ketosteroid isomerase-like protein
VSQENVDVVRQFEEMMVPSLEQEDEADARVGLERILELLDENVVFRPPSVLAHGGDWVGHQGFIEMGEAFNRAWELPEGVNFEYLDGGGDTVVIIASFDLVSKHTGKSAHVEMVEIVTVKDGKMTELVPYYKDTNPIVEAHDGVKTA